MLKYSVAIKWSDEDNGFIATVPELPGLSAFGKTKGKALSELNIAAEAYLETLEEAGEKLPVPEKLSHYSGQFRLRMTKSLHAKLATAAENEGVSMNTYIVSLLSERQGEKEKVDFFRQLIEEVQKLQPVGQFEKTTMEYFQKSKPIIIFNSGSQSSFIGRGKN